jgi:glycosyltransferase involved in cell wall biosynthesis
LKLSIIVVSYNPGYDLHRTLESICKQTFTDYEIILIDGNSNDSVTKGIIQEKKSAIAKLVIEADEGIYDAMNKGMRIAEGTFINFLNCGDEYVDEQVLSTVFEKSDNYNFLYTDILVVSKTNKVVSRQNAKSFSVKNLKTWGTRVLCHQSVFIRRELAPEYNLAFKFKAELDWYFQICQIVDIKKILHIHIYGIQYGLGGKGYINFWPNMWEKLRLLRIRFGLVGLLQAMPVTVFSIFAYYRSKFL